VRRRPLRPALLLCLLAAGCTNVGPDFVQPDAPLAESFQASESPRIKAAEPQLVAWWRAFGDPQLDALITEAYAQNLGLETAGLRVIEARAQLGIAIGNQYPQQQQLTGSATWIRRSENSANSTAGDLNYSQYGLSADLSWELDFWGRFRRGIESADATLLASIASYDDALVLLIAQVTDTYTVIRATQEQLRLARENVRLQTRSFEITNTLFRNGAESELDMQQARTLLLSTEATIPGLEATLTQATNALSVLLGRPPGDLSAALGSTGQVPNAPAELAVGVPAQLLRRRPDVREAELRAAAQSALIGVASADLYPSFALTGSLGLVAAGSTGTTRTGDSGFDALFSGDSLQFSGGPAFSWNLLNYGRIKNSVRVQDARYQQAILGYQQTVLDAAEEVENAITRFLRGREQELILDEVVTSARRSVELSTLRYREGFADYQRVLDAQQSLFTSQQRYVNAKSAAVRALIDLYKALGGGWELRAGNDFIDERTRELMRERTDWGRLLEIGASDIPPDERSGLRGPDW
jgi:NodT family efflux transporter outer membrane factor (OMF) lipoprotein